MFRTVYKARTQFKDSLDTIHEAAMSMYCLEKNGSFAIELFMKLEFQGLRQIDWPFQNNTTYHTNINPFLSTQFN